MANHQVESSTSQHEESSCLHIYQSMIDVYSQRLIGLRTQCATSAELTQQEIRSLESKIITMFSRQLAIKEKLRREHDNPEILSRYERFPNLEQWLKVVGLRQESVNAVCARVGSLEELQDKDTSWEQVVIVLTERREELDRLGRALDNLRRCTALVRDGTVSSTLDPTSTNTAESGSNMSLLDYGNQQQALTTHLNCTDEQNHSHSHSGSTTSISLQQQQVIPPLHWDSWDRRKEATTFCQSSSSSPRPLRPRPAYRASIPNEESYLGGLLQHQGTTVDGTELPNGNVATVMVPVPVQSNASCGNVLTPTLVVSPTSVYKSSIACDKTPTIEGVAVNSPLLINGGPMTTSVTISGSVSSNALYYVGSGPVKSVPVSPVSPTFSLTRKTPGLSNCRTPPACRKNTCLPTNNSVLPPLCGTPIALEFPTNLTKSKSHESQLVNDPNQQVIPNSPKIHDKNITDCTDNKTFGKSGILSSPLLRRERLPTEPGPEYGSNYDVAQLLDVQHQHNVAQFNSTGCRQVHVNVVQQGDVSGGSTVIGGATFVVGSNAATSHTAPPSPRVLGHRIAHRFQKTFKMMASCYVCLKPIYFGTGLRCKECKYRCHRDCEAKAALSCGLTPELLEAFKDAAMGNRFSGAANQAITSSGNCLIKRRKNSAPPSQNNYDGQSYQQLKDHPFSGSGFLNLLHGKHKPNQHLQQQQQQQSQPQLLSSCGTNKHQQSSQSSTNSSCNSSAPSSPAPPNVNVNNVSDAATGSTTITLPSVNPNLGSFTSSTSAAPRSSFHFPPDPITSGGNTTLLDHLQLKHRSNLPNDSQQYNSTIHTPNQLPLSPQPTRVDSQDSQMSSDTETFIEGSTITNTNSTGSIGMTTSSGGNQRQNSMTTALKEWDIPFSELLLEGTGPLGAGRFGTVWRGQWHGDVAIKILHGQDEARTLHQFRSDVSTFRKTRHENLVLFMGACTRPPHLAIVTSLCKGQTLHTLVHLRRERFSLARAAAIAQQISQGMGYLHAKGILHKDLTSKNVFLENQGTKVVITDFGLFSGLRNDRGIAGDSSGCRLAIPPGWLCYLAPELVRVLTPEPPPVTSSSPNAQLPFSQAADVFAFGTLWFELLCGDWPFRGEPPEAVIWQVGAGRKVSLTNLHATKDVKDVLMACWAYNPANREDFAQLLERLRRLPTAKRLARSPSHPVHLSRSAESVF